MVIKVQDKMRIKRISFIVTMIFLISITTFSFTFASELELFGMTDKETGSSIYKNDKGEILAIEDEGLLMTRFPFDIETQTHEYYNMMAHCQE